MIRRVGKSTLMRIIQEDLRSQGIALTGSNANLLSGELVTLLSGRHVVIPVYPLNFQEYLQYRKVHAEKENREEVFWTYMRVGGLPGIHDLPVGSPALDEFIRNIFLRDVVSCYRIRDVSILERVAPFGPTN